MKRTRQTPPIRPSNTTSHRMIDARCLTDVRGGDRITIQLVDPTPFDFPLQHNETFVRL